MIDCCLKMRDLENKSNKQKFYKRRILFLMKILSETKMKGKIVYS